MKSFYLIVFILEWLKYWLIFSVLYKAEIRRKNIGIFALLLYAVLIEFVNVTNVEKSLFLYLVVISIQFLTVRIKERKNFLTILLTVFCVTCIDEICNDIVVWFVAGMDYCFEKEVIVIISDIIMLFCIFIIHIVKKQKKWNFYHKFGELLQKGKWILIFVMASQIALVLAGLSDMKDKLLNGQAYTYMTVLSIFSFSSLVILVVAIYHVERMNEKMKETVDIEKKLRNSQKNYYEMLLQKEEETRKYRHDITNHLMCLKALADDKKTELVSHYIETLQKDMQQIQNKNYDTGNLILDILLNYHTGRIRKKTQVRVIGKCNDAIPIDEVDLCCIFANLFQNAVEAVNRIQGDEERHIYIYFKEYAGSLSCQIKNSIQEESVRLGKDGLPVTSKKEGKNHGMGMKNVKEMIEGKNGLFNFKVQGEEFICTIMLRYNQ